MWLSFLLSLVDLDGFEDAVDGMASAIEIVLLVMAVMIVVGVVQTAVDRRRGRVKIMNQGATAAPGQPHGHPGGFDDAAGANKVRGHG